MRFEFDNLPLKVRYHTSFKLNGITVYFYFRNELHYKVTAASRGRATSFSEMFVPINFEIIKNY